nr:glycosyltransferase [Bacteroidales bacterium]
NPNLTYLLFFGFIRDYKGLDLLLDALALIVDKRPNLRLIVAGEFYNNADPYLKQIEKLNLKNQVILRTDFISDVVVQPYKSATQSGVTQIAYHFEKPMIVTNVGGLPEIVPHMKTGLVSEPTSLAISSAINEFLDLPSDFFKNGLIEEKKKYSWERMLDSIMSIILQLNKSKNG